MHNQEFPLEGGTADCPMTQPDTDSGYGGSSSASLETHNDPLDPKASSAASRSCPRSQPPSDTETIQPQPQPGRIRRISKPIDTETARRVNDVIEQMSPLLQEHMVKSKRNKYLSRPKRNPPSMSIRPIMLGTTEEDAKTCLVIFCTDSHGAHDKIKDFLRKSFVKQLYQPQDSREPSFDVHVVGASPRTQARVAVGIPINSSRSETSTCTLCGTSIYFVQEESEQKQFATMGGILQLEFPDGTNGFYGLTAEHGSIDARDADDSDTSMSEGDSDYDDSSSRPTSPTTMVQIELDLGQCLDVPTEDDKEMHSGVDITEPVMARVEISALENTQDGAFRDWALFPLPTKDLEPKPNMLQLQGQSPKALKMPDGLTNMSECRTVQIITGSGLKRATLAPCLSRVLLKPGASFVRAFTVELQEYSDIRLGDSGSWVVDPLTLEVYGHLVATDVLMGAYVVPLVDIIEDIRSSLSEVSIQFPSDHLLHPNDRAMKPSLDRGTVDSLEHAYNNIPSAYDQNLYGSNSMARASTIAVTEPPAEGSSHQLIPAISEPSSMDPSEDDFKVNRASMTMVERLQRARIARLARDNWLYDASAPAAGRSRTIVPGDFLHLDKLLVIHEPCGQGPNHRTCLCPVRDEVCTDDWVTALGPTPKATDILTPVIAIPASTFSLSDSFGNTMLHLLAAREITALYLLRAVAKAPESILMATNTANQTFLHVLGAFWFDDVTSPRALLPILLGWLSRGSFDIYARDIYGRNFFHICQANLPDKSAMERILMAFDRGNFAHRDAFGVIPTGFRDYPRPMFKQNTEPPSGNTSLTSIPRLLSELRAAISDPLLEDSSGRNGLHLLADAILSEDTLQDNPGASVGDDGHSNLDRSHRLPQTESSFHMLSLRKSVVEELLRAGVDPNHYNNNGNTVLMAFAARLPEDGDSRLPCQIIETLVKSGARVNARNRMGETALHIAVRTGHKLVTKALVRAGANVHARDGEGRSILDVADITALHFMDTADYYHVTAARAWLSGLQAGAVQNPTVKQEWGVRRG